MKRKVIQLAGKTMVVSLPSKWVRRYNVQKGQEVEIEEKGRELLLKTDGEPELKRVEFDARGLSDKIVTWMLFSFNRRGFDEIELIYDNPLIIKQVQQTIKDFFIGFVIINQTNTRCVIKSVSKDSEEEFDSTLRRAFLVTLTMGENLIDSLKKNDMESLVNNLSLEKTNNQLTNFCQRILVKSGHKNADKTCFYYVILWNLEKVCDNYKYISEYLIKNGKNKFSLSKEFISFIEETHLLLKSYYTLFYNYDISKTQNFPKAEGELINKGRHFLKSSKEEEIIISSILLNHIIQVGDFVSSTISVMDNHY